jgi:hypothetical protein
MRNKPTEIARAILGLVIIFSVLRVGGKVINKPEMEHSDLGILLNLGKEKEQVRDHLKKICRVFTVVELKVESVEDAFGCIDGSDFFRISKKANLETFLEPLKEECSNLSFDLGEIQVKFENDYLLASEKLKKALQEKEYFNQIEINPRAISDKLLLKIKGMHIELKSDEKCKKIKESFNQYSAIVLENVSSHLFLLNIQLLTNMKVEILKIFDYLYEERLNLQETEPENLEKIVERMNNLVTWVLETRIIDPELNWMKKYIDEFPAFTPDRGLPINDYLLFQKKKSFYVGTATRIFKELDKKGLFDDAFKSLQYYASKLRKQYTSKILTECYETHFKYFDFYKESLISLHEGYNLKIRNSIFILNSISNIPSFKSFSRSELGHILNNFAELGEFNSKDNDWLNVVNEYLIQFDHLNNWNSEFISFFVGQVYDFIGIHISERFVSLKDFNKYFDGYLRGELLKLSRGRDLVLVVLLRIVNLLNSKQEITTDFYFKNEQKELMLKTPLYQWFVPMIPSFRKFFDISRKKVIKENMHKADEGVPIEKLKKEYKTEISQHHKEALLEEMIEILSNSPRITFPKKGIEV